MTAMDFLRAILMLPFSLLSTALTKIASLIGGVKVIYRGGVIHHPRIGFTLSPTKPGGPWHPTPDLAFSQLRFQLDKEASALVVVRSFLYRSKSQPEWGLVLYELANGKLVDAVTWRDAKTPSADWELKESHDG